MSPHAPGRTHTPVDDRGTRGPEPWPTRGAESRRDRRPTPEPPAVPLVHKPALADRDLALTADRKLAMRQLEGYTLGVARRFGLVQQESVAPAAGAYREQLLTEIARIDAELDRRARIT